ncbi:MAG: hypothetical protein IJC98_00395 [Clostridia bacterium]|nr:hypothetical protein [Clostridia bacterium]
MKRMLVVFRSVYSLCRAVQRTLDRLCLSRAMRHGGVRSLTRGASRFSLRGGRCFADVTVSAQTVSAVILALSAALLSPFLLRPRRIKNERNSEI